MSFSFLKVYILYFYLQSLWDHRCTWYDNWQNETHRKDMKFLMSKCLISNVIWWLLLYNTWGINWWNQSCRWYPNQWLSHFVMINNVTWLEYGGCEVWAVLFWLLLIVGPESRKDAPRFPPLVDQLPLYRFSNCHSPEWN